MNAYNDPNQHLFWLASRSLGVVALLLLATTVTLGLFMSGRILSRPGMAARLKHWHEAIALTAVGAIAGHGLLLVGDRFLHPSIGNVLVPFTMANQPVWTGVGIVGGWLAAIFTFSFYVRRWIGNKAWRRLHRFTLGAYVLALAHTLGSGTDARSPWLIALTVAITAPIVFGTAYRLLPGSRETRPARAAVVTGTAS